MMTDTRKPHLPKGTKWMLRCVESAAANDKGGKWLEVWGWGIRWGDKPDYCCPIFHSDNIKDDFHWNLYCKFTSAQAEQEHISCVLVEVVQDFSSSPHWRSTGRIRRHKNLPPMVGDLEPTDTFYVFRDERNAWARSRRSLSVTRAGTRALDILRRISVTEWAKAAALNGAPELVDTVQLLRELEDAAAKERNKKRRRRWVE